MAEGLLNETVPTVLRKLETPSWRGPSGAFFDLKGRSRGKRSYNEGHY